MLYNVFAKIIDMSITATVVIAVVLIIRALIYKAPKKYAYILWAIVGIRLICPVGISSPLSIYNLVNASDYSIYERHQIDTGTNSAKQSKVSTKKHTGIDDIKLNNKNNQEISKIENDDKLTDYNKKLNGEILQFDLDSGAGRKNNATVEKKGNTIFEKVIQVCAFVWITGCIIIVLWNAVLLCRINKKVAQAVRLKDNIYECDSIPTPFVFGIISPKIYIPFRLKESEQGYIISHEKYHIKRKDNIVKLSAFLICILHWFNPFVWLAYSLMIRDMEMSCDEYVLGQSAEDIRKSYSESLLGFATNTRTIGIGMLSFGESDTRKRVKRIMKFKKAGKWIGIMAVAIILISGVICLTDAGTNTKGEKVEKINDMRMGESINKAMKTITASENNFKVLSISNIGNYEIGLAYYGENEIDRNPKDGYYISGYQGKESGENGKNRFAIVCSKDGKVINKMDLTTEMFGTDQISFPVDGIKLTIADYDGDGQKNDFALGQGQTMIVQAGNYMSYVFFGVDSLGEIIQYYTSTENQRRISTLPGKYSPKFVRKDGNIEYTGLEDDEDTATTSICQKISLEDVKRKNLQPEQKLYKAIEKTMPGDVVKELEKKGIWTVIYDEELEDVTYCLGNDSLNPDLRLDFTCDKNGKLCQYDSKEYGFVENLSISEAEFAPILCVKDFAKEFMGTSLEPSGNGYEETKKDSETVWKIEDEELGRWDDSKLYSCYRDSLGTFYVTELHQGMVIHVDTDQSGTGNENEREYSVKLEDISFKIPADKVTVNNQYDKNRYIKYNYKFLGKEDMCLYVGEPEKDFIAAFSKFNFKRVEEVGEWSYFVNGKEKIIKVNCCEKADGAKYFGCYWEEKGKEFLNVQKKTADDYGMAAKVSAEIAESIEERN